MNNKKQDIAVTVGVIMWFALIITISILFC